MPRLLTTLASAGLMVCTVACSGDTASREATVDAATDLRQRLEQVRADFDLPAVAGGYVSHAGDVVVAVSGALRADTDQVVASSDLFHLGSVTKPITATLAAVLVHEGSINFETTIGQVFEDELAAIHPSHHATTLGQLLRHRGGFQPFEEDEEWSDVPRFSGDAATKRRQFVAWLLAQKPQLAPGSEHRYSNAGYSVAAVLLEQVSGESWETLLANRLFEPMGLAHYTVGWPAESELAGTWGHRRQQGHYQPHDPQTDDYRLADLYIGPAGDLALDIGGLAQFARMHLLGLAGADGLLPAEMIAKLHLAQDGDDYALGWNVFPNRSTHLGSAGTAFASIYLMRQRELALVVAANAWSEDEEAFGAALLKAVLEAAKAAGATSE